MVFAFGEIKVNAVAENAQIDDDAEDVANGTVGLVGFLQQKVVNQEGDYDQRGIDKVIGCFFGNHISFVKAEPSTSSGIPKLYKSQGP